MPQVSVVTSVYNGEAYLEECVNSILNQTFQDFEYIILNDGSTDRTSEILDRYTDPRIRIVHQRNLGIRVPTFWFKDICDLSITLVYRRFFEGDEVSI